MGLHAVNVVSVIDWFSVILRLWPLCTVGIVGCAAQLSGLRPPLPFAALQGPLIIAHRGGSLEAPENTVASITHGIAAGSDWQELDVTLSSDDQVVVIHDDTLERTTDGHGDVEKQTLAQLKRLSAGRPHWGAEGLQTLTMFGVTPTNFGDAYAKERVPTLDEILAIPGGRLMIELKKTSRIEKLASQVVEAIHRADAGDRVAVGSFESPLLQAVSRLDANLPLIGILEEAKDIERKLELPISVLAVRMDLAKDALEQRPAGVAVWVWTAYSSEMATVIAELGVHGIITDAPTAVLAALRSPPALTGP